MVFIGLAVMHCKNLFRCCKGGSSTRHSWLRRASNRLYSTIRSVLPLRDSTNNKQDRSVTRDNINKQERELYI